MERQENQCSQRRPGQGALRKGRRDIPGQIYMVTTVTHKRQPFFAELHWARAVIRTLHRPEIVGHSKWLAWVLMPDHFHALIRLGEGDSLASVIGRFKGRSAHDLNAARDTTGKIWQKSFFDRALRKEDDIRKAARYLVANPLRAGLVGNIGDYPYWDAVWL